jgi:hypothetical protein
MDYCKVPPGQDEMADAYNMMVCAYQAQHSPLLAEQTEKMARAIVRRVDDWEDATAYLSLLASKILDPVKAEKFRLEIEKRNLVPA